METQVNKRLKLHAMFKTWVKNVYFQPSSNITMKYPAIIYSRNSMDTTYANNKTYVNNTSYKVTVVDEDPDSELIEKMLNMPLCKFNTHYVSSNLNHDVFTLYY